MGGNGIHSTVRDKNTNADIYQNLNDWHNQPLKTWYATKVNSGKSAEAVFCQTIFPKLSMLYNWITVVLWGILQHCICFDLYQFAIE